MSGALEAAVSIGFHGLAFAMVLYLISVGLTVTMGAAWAAENNPKSDGAPEMIIVAQRKLIRQLRLWFWDLPGAVPPPLSPHGPGLRAPATIAPPSITRGSVGVTAWSDRRQALPA